MSLWQNLVAMENLAAAAREARRGKRFRRDVLEFEARREENLTALRNELMEGSYRPGPYRSFVVRDPKPRDVAAPAYRDRVVHHALMRILAPAWDRLLPRRQFACRPGMGTHAAMQRAQRLSRRYPFVLKMDVRRFYPSVAHEVLKRQLERFVPDASLREVLGRVIDSYDSGRPGRGIAIGALTSQWLALLMLRPLHLHLMLRLRAPLCVYMDDHLIFGGSKAELRFVRDRVVEYLPRLGLEAHAGKRVIHRSGEGFPFVGYRVFPTHVRVAGRSKVRAVRKMRQWARASRLRCVSVDRVRSAASSWFGHWKRADSHYLSRATLCAMRF